MEYKEALPKDCPPSNAEEIQTEMTVFRLVKTQVPTEYDDFSSARFRSPTKTYSANECIVCGLSVYTDKADLETVIRHGRFKGRFICAVKLTPNAGKILQTGKPSHHTWWPYKDFNILDNSALAT